MRDIILVGDNIIMVLS